MTESPKIFISYSWTDPSHEDWVINLAQRLVSDGVDVVIDKWTLKEGQDKFNFMESMVKSRDVHRVLIILDKRYAEKAEQRAGGVGTETQIISPKIYNNVSQEKFIPIISERDEEGNAYIPTFLEGRIYIDLSEQDHFEANYETLLRNIYNRPGYSKPKLGKRPGYLFEETPMTHKTSSLIRSFDNQVSKNPKRINAIIREFLDDFFDDLKGYSIVAPPTKEIFVWGKVIHDNIISYTPLRNDFIFFIDKILKAESDFDLDVLIKFFEKLPSLKYPQDNRGSWTNSEFDNFRFFIHELFLYSIALGLKNENYKFVEELLYSSYFFQDKYRQKSEPGRFDEMYNPVEVFDQYYNQTYSEKYFSPMADLMMKRIPENISRDNLIDADLICHYIAALENLYWFPITYVYRSHYDGKIDLFNRLVSLRHFEKVKMLFNVKTPQELKEKFLAAKMDGKNSERISYPGSHNSVIPIYRLLEVEKIGSLR